MTVNGTRAVGLPIAISDKVRGLITRGALSPGVHLGQTELAERFEASRVPVREALKLLTAEGIVVHDPHRGFFVAQVTSSEARQLYRMRHLVETELLETIAFPTAAELRVMEQHIKSMERCLTEADYSGWALHHREFHRRIFELSDQKVLVREVLRLWSLTDRYRSLLPPPKVSDHDDLGERMFLDALSRRDRKALIRNFHKDRSRVERMLLSILTDRNL